MRSRSRRGWNVVSLYWTAWILGSILIVLRVRKNISVQIG